LDAIAAIKPRRQDLLDTANLCEHCTAKCCRYIALPIDSPDDPTQYDYMRWFLLHRGATVFTEGDSWFLLVYSDCEHLQPDGRCGIYETRPQICRDYSTKNCEYEDDWTYDRYFEFSCQLEEYHEALAAFRPAKGKSIRSPKPVLLPILSS
jgi:uncharacterized protein